eukprot:TRINITY_DN16036_c0_g1_i16.p1 TRINITY_DN16036_c0_g1~~TRINITY_DN16036_c0_g1_i16.p1  ORF type:complete len:251 (+),score=70.88 TRINITY_DN16036_c0_g1_i16:195-947(+)
MDKPRTIVKPDAKLLQALINLYLSVKVRSEHYISTYTEEQLQSERKSLLNANPLNIVEYIKTSVEILLNLKEEEKVERNEARSLETQESYEEQIQKLEAETRMHIRLEQQLKLHIDSMQGRLEENEKIAKKLKFVIKNIQTELIEAKEQLIKKNLEVDSLKKSLNDKMLKLAALERGQATVKKLPESTSRHVHHNKVLIHMPKIEQHKLHCRQNSTNPRQKAYRSQHCHRKIQGFIYSKDGSDAYGFSSG